MMIDSISPFVFAHVLAAYGLTYTNPVSKQRYLLAGLIFACCLISAHSTPSKHIPGLVGREYVIGFAFQASYYLWLAKLTPPFNSLSRGRFLNSWTINQLFTARWGVKHIPPFDKRKPSAVPSRSAFLISRACDCLFTATAIYFYYRYRLNILIDDYLDVPDGFLGRLSSLTPREVVIRIYVTIGGQLVPYCSLRCIYGLVSFFAVAVSDSPSRWPPLFGSIREAYSVRRYYALFWHHLMRNALTAHAGFVVNRVLGFPKDGLLSRYMVILGTFVAAAALHIAASPFSADCSIYPQLRYCCTMAGAIILEDIAFKVSRSLRHSAKKDTPSKEKEAAASKPWWTTPLNSPFPLSPFGGSKFAETGTRTAGSEGSPSGMERAAGYLWVFLVHIWAASKFVYRTKTCEYAIASRASAPSFALDNPSNMSDMMAMDF